MTDEVTCWRGKCDNDPSEYVLCAKWQRRESPCYEGPEIKKSFWARFVRLLVNKKES